MHRPSRVSRLAGAVLLLSLPLALHSARDNRPHLSSERYLDDIRYLTSEALGGRASGSPGLAKAAEYISGQFARVGLRPLGSGSNSFYQTFPVSVGARKGPNNKLRWTNGAVSHDLEAGQDFEPYAFSSSMTLHANLVFAGYGASACEYGYDDYAGIDARGKVVVLLRHEPQEYDASSPFEGRVYTEHSQVLRKVLTAKAHGAAGVILVNDAANHSGPDTLEKLTSLPSPGNAGIPFVGVKSSVVEQWFEAAGHNFTDAQTSIDKTLEPASFDFPTSVTIDLATDVKTETRSEFNVIGYLPGQTSEYVVIGAHYDHLGTGEQYSLAPNMSGTMHPGADDNASGTAAVLNLARYFADQPKMRRGIVFVAFAGEEIGLLGSTWFTNSSPLPLKDAVAMINMDMIGRMREHTLIVGGTGSADGLKSRLDAAAKKFPFELQTGTQAVYGSSDHTSFTSHGIPALFFFTGLHADYHRPSDTADKINAKEAASVADLVAEVASSLAQTADRPSFRYPAKGKSCK